MPFARGLYFDFGAPSGAPRHLPINGEVTY
jgi:hypothetical protein